MGLNLGSRAMIAALREAQPETGLKKLTTEVNELLPSKMQVQKHELRDFVRSLGEPADRPVAAIKPRDESFMKNVAEQAFTILREAEREFLLNLDHYSITKMHNPSDSPKCHPVAHLRYHFQVLLALKGIVPCVPFVSPKETGTDVMNAMVLRCLVPVMEQLDLESYGFRLLYIASDVLTSTIRFRGFKGSWVLADTQSAAWNLIREIFTPLPPRDPARRIPEKVMCVALGFPVYTNNIINEVVIRDRTEYELLQDSFDQDTCRVCAMKIFCDNGSVEDWQAIRSYYMVCRDIALELGTVLDLDLGDHPMMAQWCS
ncbi:hypothetical protein SLS64_007351 [Diaporthe eres]